MRKTLSLISLLLVASVGTLSPAHATGSVLFTESFETCTDPAGPPFYTEYETATAAAEPIKVNLWINERINCPGWTASGQAWMTTYSSGGIFPDGSHAAWLNEGPPAGSISREISGLTAEHDYELILETWTDDQDQATALTVKVTNGSDVQELTYELEAGQGIQALSNFFSAYGDTITLELIGSTATYASPLVDNIRVVDAGLTSEREESGGGAGGGGDGSGGSESSSGTKSKLAETGFDALTVGGVAAFLLAGGAVLMVVRRRASRR